MSTSSLLLRSVLKPRALMPQPCAFFWATCRFEAGARRASARNVVAPERRMSSRVMTWIAEAVSASFSRTLGNRRDFEVHELFDASGISVS